MLKTNSKKLRLLKEELKNKYKVGKAFNRSDEYIEGLIRGYNSCYLYINNASYEVGKEMEKFIQELLKG